MLAFFPTLDGAGDAVARIIAAAIDPVTIELLDHETILAVDEANSLGLDREAAAMLLVESDLAPAGRGRRARGRRRGVRGGRRDVGDPGRRTRPRPTGFARRAGLRFRALERQGTVLMEDVGVPRSRVPDLLRAIDAIGKRQAIADRDLRPRR